MYLMEEWSKRIDIWFEELKNHVFIKLGTIEFSGWITRERLTYSEALSHTYVPMLSGTPWGAKWEYGWFQTELVLPIQAEGKRIYFHPDVGGEMLVWVNGTIIGSKDLQHDGLTLTRRGHAGDRYHILVESYAGHGPRLENGGPCPPERTAVEEPSLCQVVVGDSDYGIWNEDAYQLLMDVYTLKRLYEGLDPDSLRAMKIREGLMKFSMIVDFELSMEDRTETFRKAREQLMPLLHCVNGSTAPVFTIFGQSHLDLAWKWPWEETRRKCARTISNQLTLADEYEAYRFLLCEPPIMENIKESYPDLYDRVMEKVKTGSFVPEGGMYVESDTNLVSGESLVRQCLYGRKWFRENMGVESVLVWLPDCFGFTGQLPQIMRGCGFRYFATQKLARAMKGCAVFPYNTFIWKGIDGTGILTNFHKENNAKIDPLDLIGRWKNDRVQKQNMETFLYPFGYGDGGGGATRDMMEIARRCKDLEGVPRTKMESPVAFFEAIEKKGEVVEIYEGELYLPWHRGTYTSQAWIKERNRRMEELLREAEWWNGISMFLGLGGRSQKELERVWKILLFQQFHDILPGTSITRVYEDARIQMEEVKQRGEAIIKEAQERIGLHENREKGGYMVFHSLSWDRVELVELPFDGDRRWMQDRKILPIQKRGHVCLVPVHLPSCGMAFIESVICAEGKMSASGMGEMKEESESGLEHTVTGCVAYETEEGFVLENSYVQVRINYLGEITGLKEKKTGEEYMAGIGNCICMYQDVNVDYDAWELSSFYSSLPVELEKKADVLILESGPLEAVIEVKRRLHDSQLIQRIKIRFNSRRIDFETVIDWRETHKLLKVQFPFQIHARESVEEIPFGNIHRPNHMNTRHDADQYEVSCRHYACLTEPGRVAAVLNDSKYGISAKANCLELTLLKSPVWPDMYADKGEQKFTYSVYIEPSSLEQSQVVREGYQLNHQLKAIPGSAKGSYIKLSNTSVILETVKLSEDGSGNLILRFYEPIGAHTSVQVSTCLPVESGLEVDMEEYPKDGKKLLIEKKGNLSSFHMIFVPYEIKTIRLLGIKQSKKCNYIHKK